jgi:hypothetical protein
MAVNGEFRGLGSPVCQNTTNELGSQITAKAKENVNIPPWKLSAVANLHLNLALLDHREGSF